MKTDEVCDHCLETFGAATFGVIYGFVFCCKGRNVSYAFVIYNKYYTKSMRIWQAINRFAKKDEHSALFNQICYDFSAKRRKILLKNR